jgi:predicted phosphodiesterase
VTIESALVFISDLHFGPSFHEETEILPLDWASWIKLFASRGDLDAFFVGKCGSHNKAIVRALPKYLRRLLIGMQRNNSYARETFDQCVALGDLVTWPNPDAFWFFTQYITQDRWRDAVSSSTLTGLDFKSEPERSQITAIPGNHDKMLRQNLNLFDTHVREPLSLEAINPQSATIIRRQIGTLPFVFLAVDASTYTRDPDLRVTRSAKNHLAGGSVSAGLLQQVKALTQEIAAEDGVRVLLIHYPIDFSVASKLSGVAQNFFVRHDVDGINRLLEAIPQGVIHFAAHGHLHSPGFYSSAGFPVLSLGTTFQLNNAINDFYVVTVSDSRQIRADHHVWTPTGFKHDDTLSGRLN